MDSPSYTLVTTANSLAVETSVVSSMITEKCDICNFFTSSWFKWGAKAFRTIHLVFVRLDFKMGYYLISHKLIIAH